MEETLRQLVPKSRNVHLFHLELDKVTAAPSISIRGLDPTSVPYTVPCAHVVRTCFGESLDVRAQVETESADVRGRCECTFFIAIYLYVYT